MSAAPAGSFCDPTLYRVFSFVAWLPSETVEASAQRVQHLEAFLQKLKWMPPSDVPLQRADLEDVQRVLWNPPWESLHGEWSIHRCGMSYPETLIVLLGVEQDGVHTDAEAWLQDASRQWTTVFEHEGNWSSSLLLPDQGHGDHPSEVRLDRPRLLGQADIWSTERQGAPVTGWASLGQDVYGEGNYTTFPWGLLGWQRRATKAVPRFDLYTTTDETDKSGRDTFLFSYLPIIVTEYTKGTQFLNARYKRSLRPEFDRKEAQVEQQIASDYIPNLTLWAIERGVADQMHFMLQFSSLVRDLNQDVHSVKIARDAITGELQFSGAKTIGKSLVQPIDLLAWQMESDLTYCKTTQQLVRDNIEVQKARIDIEVARVEHILTYTGVALAVLFSLQQVLTGLSPKPPPLVSTGVSVLVAILVWCAFYWFRLRKKVG